ncbi:class I SAM-dependent methyltransferase [Halalkalibacter urbisdiaboli]|uniref:class I SAM-dependent methyltransferase n=1 Tax=Halalkalibacter urbisdiaboli TaxID=1960589 RepID=UPI000B435A38|nr:class I SAM-dependent methyltransferase [Halalkalibacter urbisdiaboli]
MITREWSMEEIWQEGMKDAHGRIPSRMLNDNEEEEFWKRHLTKKSFEQPVDDYAHQLANHLMSYIKSTDSVLEIGPGWGNYTFALANKAKSITCVEPSESCIRFLQTISEQNDQSLSFIQSKWEDYDNEEKVDVVVGINCFYRMFEIKKALKRMNETATRKAIIGMTTAPMRPHYVDLEREYGCRLNYPKRDYVHLFHLLYELGIYANCQMVPLVKTYTFSSREELIEKNKVKFVDNQIESQKVEKALLPYIKEKDGLYHYTHRFYGALIDWTPTTI